MLAHTKMLGEVNARLVSMMTWPHGRLDWSSSHNCRFPLDKSRVMGFTRRREPNPDGRPHTRPVSRLPISLRGV